MKRTPLNRGNKQLVSKSRLKANKGLSSSGGLKTRKPLKSASVIRKRSEKANKQAKEYRKNVIGKNTEDFGLCRGCGVNKPLTNSHLCKRSQYEELVAVRENVEGQCHECHDKWEFPPKRFELLNYSELRERVRKLSTRAFRELEYQEQKHGWQDKGLLGED